jgi:hypothetical protein
MKGGLAMFVALLLAGPVQASPWDARIQAKLLRGEDVVRVVPVAGVDAPQVWIDRIVDAPIAKIAAIAAACEKYVGMIPRVQKVVLIKKGAPNHICELYLDMPFPFSDVRSTIGYSGSMSADQVTITYTQIRGDYKIHAGGWYLRAVGNKTWIHYRLHVDLGQPLPKWLINSFSKGALKTTLDNVTKRARTR